MIVTSHFVYIHIHRSAGQFALEFIRRFYQPILFEGYHYPLSYLPDEYRHLPVVGLIRSPLDWYLSWYYFNAMQPRNPIYPIVSNFGKASQPTTIMNVLKLGQNTQQAQGMRKMIRVVLPQSLLGNTGTGITQSCIDSLADSGKGYYSWLVNRMFSGFPAEREIYTQSMHQPALDIVNLWGKAGLPMSNEMRLYLQNIGKINASTCRTSEPELSGLLKELILELDSDVYRHL